MARITVLSAASTFGCSERFVLERINESAIVRKETHMRRSMKNGRRRAIGIAALLLSGVVAASSSSAQDTAPGNEKRAVEAGIHGKEAADAPAESEHRLISLVVLVKEPRKLDEKTLRDIVSKAVGAPAGNDTGDATFLVSKPPYYRVKLPSGYYVINNIDKPYFDNLDKLAADIEDPALRTAVKDHRAWISVDWAGKEEPDDPKAVYNDIGRIAAALAPPDGLAVYSPEVGQLSVFDNTVAGKMAGGDPIQLFLGNSPDGEIVFIADDDPDLQKAEAEARKDWPEFTKAYQAKSGKNFVVKGRISEGENVEYMWINVTSIDGDTVRGTLDNEPVGLKGVKAGQAVEIKVADVDDWLYIGSDNKPVGGYTLNRRQMAGR
jgi:uncharacterized protein YegJ (DUF2314 family)